MQSANVEEGQLGEQLDGLLAWIGEQRTKAEGMFGQLHVDRAKLAEQMERLSPLHAEIVAKDGQILVTR